LESPV